MKQKTETTIKTDTAISVVSMKQIQRCADQVLDAVETLDVHKGTKSKLTGLFAAMIFQAAHEGLDVSYRALKERLTATQLGAVKGAASKGSNLHSYLKAGNSLKIEATETMEAITVTLENVLDGSVTISTAYAAMVKAKKSAETMAKLATDTAIEEVTAYLESGKAEEVHVGIPTEALTQTLAMNGGLDTARKVGREHLAKVAKIAEKEASANRIRDYIQYLEGQGYTVTKG